MKLVYYRIIFLISAPNTEYIIPDSYFLNYFLICVSKTPNILILYLSGFYFFHLISLLISFLFFLLQFSMGDVLIGGKPIGKCGK